MPDIQKFDLIVVGGGISGLSTVLHLLQQKFPGNIGLLEARNRLGGRIHTCTTKIERKNIEMGANWIHGIINNPIYEILYKRQIIDSNTESDKRFYNISAKTMNGQDVEPILIRKVSDAYSTIIQGSLRISNPDNIEKISQYQDCLGKYLNGEINKWIEKNVPKTEPSTIGIVRGLFDSLIKRETCISGAHSMNDVSLQYFDQYKEFLGGNITIPLGYYSVIEVILDEIKKLESNNQEDKTDQDQEQQQKKFHYFLESVVDKIEWPGLSQSDPGHNLIRIHCCNGTMFECKHLILTTTLGCLKKHALNLFVPPLPDYKLQCIKRMGFDVVDKIFMEYSSYNTIQDAFSKDGITFDEIMLLWNADDSDAEDGGSGEEKPWYRKIYSIYRISDHCMQLWASGKEAMVLENLHEDQINDQLTEQFRRIFRDKTFPRADNLIITKWGTDPYSFGSYSFISNNSAPDDIDDLAKPIYSKPNDEMPTIVFGGEATHKEYFSTVHGAYLSGIECAKHFQSN